MNLDPVGQPARVVAGISSFAVDDDVVVVGARTGPLALTGVGALLWRLIESGEPLTEIVHDVSVAGGIEPAVTQARLHELVDQLQLLGVLEAAETAAPERRDAPPSEKVGCQVGSPLPDAALTRVGGEVVSTRGGNRRILLVNWDEACAHCAELGPALAAARLDLDAHDVHLVLVDDRDSATFVHTGTPTGYLVGRDGRLERPMVAGTSELSALVDELSGRDRPRPAPDVARLPAPPPMSVRGDRFPLRRSVWAGTRVYELHGLHVGIRVDSENTGLLLDRLFPTARRHVPDTPANYTLELARHDPVHGHAGNVLGSGGSVLVQSRSSARVVTALLLQLADDLGLGSDDPPAVTTAAVLRDGGALLVPWALRRWSPRLESLLAEQGAAFADGPFVQLDVERREVVLPSPATSHDPAVVDELDAADAERGLGGEVPRVRPGRHHLDGWWFGGDEDRDLSTTGAVARALPCLRRITPSDELVAGLARCLDAVPTREFVATTERDFATRVAAVAN